MKIIEAIQEFKRILNLFETNKQDKDNFICLTTDNEEFKSLFDWYKGYYRNYMNVNVLKTGGLNCYSKEMKLWKINFMQQEIISLNKLLRQGYTDI